MKTFKELYEACCAACEKRADIEEVKEPTGDLKKACWKGYTAVGMKMKNGRKVPNCVPANEEVEEIEERNKENAMRRKVMDASRGARYKLDNKVPDREPQHKTAQAHNKAIGRALRSEESELDEARNTYALYDDHPKFQTAHSEIHAAVTNAHKDPKAVVTAMRKHKQVGATDSASRDTIYNQVKRLHGAKVANDTKVLDEEVEQIDELSKKTLGSYEDKARMDQNDTLSIAHRKYSSPEERAKYKAIADKRGKGRDLALAKLSPKGTRLYSDRTVAKQAKVVAKEDVEQIDEISKDMATRYMKQIERQPGLDKDHPDKRKPSRFGSQKIGYERAFNKVSPYGRRVKVPATEETQKGKNVVPPHVGALATGGIVKEATYQGKEVTLNKPMAGDVKKSKVYVDPDGDGTAQKVNFGDKNMTIKKNIPARRKSFRARHNCENPGPKNKARYWSCKAW